MLRFLGIVGLGMAAGVAFGLLQTGVTAVACEFDPTGLIVHPLIGLILGLGLAVAARAGRRPKRAGRSLVRSLVVLVVTMTLFAVAAGVVGFTLGNSGRVMMPAEVQERIPAEKRAAFQASALANQASYNVAFVGGGMLIAWVWVSRKRLHPTQVAT